ncbi:MAG TPA: alkaline phosphatase D family protein [Gaiellaceae bacterium]|nr:alkaline phosphatase D family protein [Gaiellaceae bacterium]
MEPTVRLVLGPMLRYAGTESASFWVETSAPCEVEILGQRVSTFAVEGHHYALLLVSDLTPASVTPYDVRLDGELVWPPDDGRPAPAVHTRNHEPRLRLVFGSCRVGDPLPTNLGPTWPADVRAIGIDALWTYAKQLQRGEMEWPDALMLLGDQTYADEVSPATLEFIRERRGTDVPPGEQIADFEEFTRLYRESWSEPDIRWLLSTIPTVMIFDDHDVIDDWNISWLWVEEMRREPWWESRITGAFMAYWVYQHLGNLSPPELEADTTFPQVLKAGDAGPLLRELAHTWDRESAASRWAFYRDFGDTRLLVLDSRAARVLSDGRRQMIDDDEWDWIVEHSSGAFDHVLIASTLPVFLPHGIHHLQAWNEALCAGRWGRLVANLSERLRRAVDLEHWAAFNRSFEQLCDWLRTLTRGTEGADPPASILLLGGDVHSSSIHEVDLKSGSSTRVHQLVCSPFRNPLSLKEQRILRATGSHVSEQVFARLAKLAGVEPPSASWEAVRSATFDNGLGELVLDGRRASAILRRSPREGEDPELLVADPPVMLTDPPRSEARIP